MSSSVIVCVLFPYKQVSLKAGHRTKWNNPTLCFEIKSGYTYLDNKMQKAFTFS